MRSSYRLFMLREYLRVNLYSTQRALTKRIDLSFRKLNSCEESLIAKNWLKVMIGSDVLGSRL